MRLNRSKQWIGLFTGLLGACTSEGTTELAPPTAAEAQLETLRIPALNNSQMTSLSGNASMLRLLLTDAPVEADNVFVTFCGVHVSSKSTATEDDASKAESTEDGGVGPETATEASASADDADDASRWLTVSEDCQTHDLLALQDGIATDLGLGTLPAGSYGQIRLILTEASIVVEGDEYPLTVPSGTQSGIKIGHGFELEAGSLTTLALDFDAARSIRHTRGAGYIMRPVIKLAGERTERFADATAREAARENETNRQKEGDGATESDSPERGMPATPAHARRNGTPERASDDSAGTPPTDNAPSQPGRRTRGMPERYDGAGDEVEKATP